MLRSVLKYAAILGSLGFVLQVLQRGIGLGPGELYPPLLVLAALFVALGFIMGHTWEDRSHGIIRKKLLFQQLTEREREVAGLILQGKSNKEIQEALHVERSTLKTHINQIYRKGGIESRRAFKQLFKPDGIVN